MTCNLVCVSRFRNSQRENRSCAHVTWPQLCCTDNRPGESIVPCTITFMLPRTAIHWSWVYFNTFSSLLLGPSFALFSRKENETSLPKITARRYMKMLHQKWKVNSNFNTTTLYVGLFSSYQAVTLKCGKGYSLQHFSDLFIENVCTDYTKSVRGNQREEGKGGAI